MVMIANRASVLLVDTDELFRQALGRLLRGVGYHVLGAPDGVAGLRTARRHAPDLVIADLWLFFCGALEMVEQICSPLASRSTPVLVLTSAVSPDFRDRALAAGCPGYLEKPCPPERLLAEMAAILGPGATPPRLSRLPLRATAAG